MKRRVLIVQFSANPDGSAFSGLMLADGLRQAGWETHVVFSFEGSIIDRFRKVGHRVHVVPHKSWLRTGHSLRFIRNVLKEVLAARSFSKTIAALQPDLVYINTAVSLAGALAARQKGVPCIWHLRELFSDVGGEMNAPPMFMPLIRGTLRTLAGRIVVNSEAVAENMLRTAAPKAIIVPNAVDAVFFDDTRSPAVARQLFKLTEKERVVGVPGTLRPMKGHPFFFEALARLAKKRSGLIAVISGGGNADYVRRLETQVRELGLEQMVRFLGYVDDMPSFYRACDVVCIPSVAEPFGRTVIEAFAAGTPVVATAVGGIRETVDDGRTGLLVPYGDVELLTTYLDRLLEDADSRVQLRRNARLEAEDKYKASVYQTRLCSIVQDLAEVGNSNSRPL